MKIATSQTLQHLCSCKGRMEKLESGTRNRKQKRNRNGTYIETRVNWEALKPVPDTRVGIKFKMASSVIIVLRNFQHSDRDTKGILTFRKRLAKKR